jgi:hypothetical protein
VFRVNVRADKTSARTKPVPEKSSSAICADLARTNQLRAGITLKKCIDQLDGRDPEPNTEARATCENLSKKGQLAAGVSVAECISRLSPGNESAQPVDEAHAICLRLQKSQQLEAGLSIEDCAARLGAESKPAQTATSGTGSLGRCGDAVARPSENICYHQMNYAATMAAAERNPTADLNVYCATKNDLSDEADNNCRKRGDRNTSRNVRCMRYAPGVTPEGGVLYAKPGDRVFLGGEDTSAALWCVPSDPVPQRTHN